MANGDTTLRDIVGYNLTRANSATLLVLAQVLEPFGLRRVTYSAMAVVEAQPGLRQADLADALAIDRANLVMIVNELEDDGLISRTRSVKDKRAYALKLTKEGAEVIRKAHDAIRLFDANITAGLTSAERRTLIKLLSIIERNASG